MDVMSALFSIFLTYWFNLKFCATTEMLGNNQFLLVLEINSFIEFKNAFFGTMNIFVWEQWCGNREITCLFNLPLHRWIEAESKNDIKRSIYSGTCAKNMSFSSFNKSIYR